MRLLLIGPGRAGTSLALASRAAGHTIAGVVGRRVPTEVAARLDSVPLTWDDPWPHADLIVVAVPDDAIAEVGARLQGPTPAVHLSGLTSATALGASGTVGSLHPLRSLPDPDTGWAALRGAPVAITAADPGLRSLLHELADSIGAEPFDLGDDQKVLYHAGASAAANHVVTALALAARCFEAAGVDFAVARPLVEGAVANAFELGPTDALTGPIARGDVGTVTAQREAVAVLDPIALAIFDELTRATARLAGTVEAMEEVLGEDRRDV